MVAPFFQKSARVCLSASTDDRTIREARHMLLRVVAREPKSKESTGAKWFKNLV
jgi:hypothetical protein